MAQEVQTIIFTKKDWTLREAKKWLADHDKKSDKLDETDDSYRFRQFPPTECKEGSFQTLTKNMPKGLSMVACERKARKGAELLVLKYEHVLRAAMGATWAILPEKLDDIMAFLRLKCEGGDISEEEIRQLMAAQHVGTTAPTAIAVLPLFGTIAHRAGGLRESSGGTSSERFGSLFKRAIADSSISAIVIDVDSPGGMVNGADELAAEIFAGRKVKPVVAVANSLMASAAYWIASAAGEVVAIPSAEIGSIGVIALHTESAKRDEELGIKHTIIRAGKHKADASRFEPLSEEAREHIQGRVDEFYGMFTRRVAKNRDVSVRDVTGGFGEGRLVGAKEALAEGMIDRIATMDQVLRGLVSKPTRSSVVGSATAELIAEAEKPGVVFDKPAPAVPSQARRRFEIFSNHPASSAKTEK